MVSFYKKDFTTLSEKEDYGRPDIVVLDPGTYDMEVYRVEHFSNKAGTGSVLAITFFVADGEKYAKEYINYPHSNDTTEWHGRKQLRALTDITGGFHHHAQIEGKKVRARVCIGEGDRPRNQFEFLAPEPVMDHTQQGAGPAEKQFWA